MSWNLQSSYFFSLQLISIHLCKFSLFLPSLLCFYCHKLSLFMLCFFLSFLFFVIFYCLCYYSCPNFSPFVPLHTHSHSLRQSPRPRPCPWVMCRYSLATLFPTLYFTPHDYSVTTNLYFIIPPLFSPISPTPSHLATIKTFFVSLILFLFCLFVYFVF